PSFALAVSEDGKQRWPFALTGARRATIRLYNLRNSPTFPSDQSLEEIVEKVRQSGVKFSSANLNGDLSIPLSELAPPSAREKYLAVLKEIIERLRET
ncbi:MAG: hypothetical protein ABI306_02115, partial [Caulobacteraceae bacterium]